MSDPSFPLSTLCLLSPSSPSLPPSLQLVTRAVRVIDLITNLSMTAFHGLGGWNKMLDRLELEVAQCRSEVPSVLPTTVRRASPAETEGTSNTTSLSDTPTTSAAMEMTTSIAGTDITPTVVAMDTTDERGVASSSDHTPSLVQTPSKPCSAGVLYTCMPERAALIKSILNFLKKALSENIFSENLRTCEYWNENVSVSIGM